MKILSSAIILCTGAVMLWGVVMFRAASEGVYAVGLLAVVMVLAGGAGWVRGMWGESPASSGKGYVGEWVERR